MQALGWLPELPDHRDWSIDAHPMMVKTGSVPMVADAGLPDVVDLMEFCSPIENQGRLGSCTANAVVGCVEFFERQYSGRHTDASRLFLYKTSRNLHGWTGDTGMYIRSAMKALSIFGVPPEKFWPYVVEDFDSEPSAFAYSYAQQFRATHYYRLDTSSIDRAELLHRVKRTLSYSIPVVFGFVVYSYGSSDGTFPLPEPGDRPLGGHAIVAVGYDDRLQALRIRNSWGTGWGDSGYGWLPYGYVTRGLSSDFWALYHQYYRRD